MTENLGGAGPLVSIDDGVFRALGEILDAQLAAVVATGSVGAGICVALMIGAAAWCLVQQVRYRYGQAQSPVATFASGILIVASGVFALIALHPQSILPSRDGQAMMMILLVFVGVLAGWSVFANVLATRIRRRHADEAADQENPVT